VTWAGSAVMDFFGITIDSLRAVGGIIVLVIGLHMLFTKSEHKQSDTELENACRWLEGIAPGPCLLADGYHISLNNGEAGFVITFPVRISA